MARSVWSGTLTFGLVTLPVSLATATQSHTVRFHQLERGTSDRVRNRRVNERTGEEVPYDRIVKGYDTGDGEYVVVEPEELDEITPGRSRSIEIVGFAELEAIDPVYFDSTYFVQPRDESYSNVYGLLRRALGETGRAGIATMSMRQKEYLVAVHTEGEVVVMHTMHWADEVRDPLETLDNLPSGAEPSAKELKAATRLIEAMAMDWDPEAFHDTTQERIRELVEAKQRGETVEKAAPAPESTNVVDLMSVLQDSVDRAHRSRGGGGKRKPEPKPRPEGGTAGRPRARREDLSGLTKAELYRRAADAGVSGRSSMSRDELARAVADAAGGSRPARRAS
jgi:DNA end-binding protein Ku